MNDQCPVNHCSGEVENSAVLSGRLFWRRHWVQFHQDSHFTEGLQKNVPSTLKKTPREEFHNILHRAWCSCYSRRNLVSFEKGNLIVEELDLTSIKQKYLSLVKDGVLCVENTVDLRWHFLVFALSTVNKEPARSYHRKGRAFICFPTLGFMTFPAYLFFSPCFFIPS